MERHSRSSGRVDSGDPKRTLVRGFFALLVGGLLFFDAMFTADVSESSGEASGAVIFFSSLIVLYGVAASGFGLIKLRLWRQRDRIETESSVLPILFPEEGHIQSIGIWVFSIIVFALIWGGLVVSNTMIQAGAVWTELIFFWIFIGLVVGPLMLAIIRNCRRALSAARFGEIPLILISSPVCFGDTLEGILIFPNDKAPKAIVAKLVCLLIEDGEVTVAEKECRQFSKPEILELVAKRAPKDVTKLTPILNTCAAQIPISLQVPTIVPGVQFSDYFENKGEEQILNEKGPIYWKVRVSAELTGIDLIRSYQVVVWTRFNAQTWKPSPT